MPRRPLESLTESMFYVLMAFCSGPMCGTAVSEYIEQKTGGAVQLGPATLYTILGKFEKEGYLRETEVSGRRRTYEITPLGREAYEAELNRLRRCLHDAETEGGVLHEQSVSPSGLPLSPLPCV